MILLTDRDLAGPFERSDDCRVVRLGGPLPAPPRADEAIVCDVDLESFDTVAALRDALATLRGATNPLHVVLRDDVIAGRALANAFGATTIGHGDGALARIGSLVRDHAAAAGAPAPTREDYVEPAKDIAVAARTLVRIFDAVLAKSAVQHEDLEQGVVALLRSTKEAGIREWVEIVRTYDDATYQHCLLVSGLVAAFTMQLGLSLPRQRMLVQAALLHDIGKAKVPRDVLNKAGALTMAEQTIVRRHPSDGYFMLARQGGLEAGVLEIVLHHHELLDGSGYPYGLRREQISDVVRIATICDIYAALIERRPYRQPMKPDAAYAVLLDMGGKLDANLVAAFHDVSQAMADPRAIAA